MIQHHNWSAHLQDGKCVFGLTGLKGVFFCRADAERCFGFAGGGGLRRFVLWQTGDYPHPLQRETRRSEGCHSALPTASGSPWVAGDPFTSMSPKRHASSQIGEVREDPR